MIPATFEELLIVPKSFQQFYRRIAEMTENNADDIVSIRHFCYVENSPVDLCRACYLSLFAKRDRRARFCEIICDSCLDLDETKRLSVQGNDVDLARYFGTVRVSSDRHFEISENDSVAVLFKELSSELLTLFADKG